MSLQIIAGASGSGKSYRLFQNIIKSSMEHPDKNYIVVVPEQFTMSTQKELVRLTPNHAISNIDVVSFARLAYRIMEETGRANTAVMDEIGKSLILRRIAAEKDEELTILKGNMKKIGYISEMKSVISEFTQYGITVERLEELTSGEPEYGALSYKLKDLLTIYKAFKEEIKDKCITAEEVLNVLAETAASSGILKDSEIAFDGYTGFTPVQYDVMDELLKISSKVYVTVTLDGRYEEGSEPAEHELFRLSKNTISKLIKIAKEARVPVEDIEYIEGNYRLKDAPELSFLEQNIFRYSHEKYEGECKNIRVQRSADPRSELEFIAGEISRLVREEGYRYRDISIVTGDVATYSRLADHIMETYHIPVFMDYKRDVLHNPFIECIRSALAVVSDNFKFNSVFRYLKCGMPYSPGKGLFLLENYCIARGIKGRIKWSKEWKNYKDSPFSDEDMAAINELRQKVFEPLNSLYESFKGDSTVRDKTMGVYGFLTAINAQQLLKDMESRLSVSGDMSKEKEYSQIYKIVIDLLDEYVDLLGDTQISGEDYIQILEAGFSEARIGIIPLGMDMVTLGDITRTRLGDIKILFFAGVNDGIIPAADPGAGLISQTERIYLSEKIELAPTVREKAYIQRFYLYLNMTKPKDKLYISYSAVSADGNGIMPSYLIPAMANMFGEDVHVHENDKFMRIATPESALIYLTEHFEEAGSGESDELWRDLYRWYTKDEKYSKVIDDLSTASIYSYDPNEDNVGEELARKIYGDFLKNSVTRLETYSRCAFAHFLERGLGLSERGEFEITNQDTGNVMHKALEVFTRKMMDLNYGWATLPEELMDSMAESCVEEAANEELSELFKSSARNNYMINRLKRFMKRTVIGLQKQMQQGDYEQAYVERKFSYVFTGQDSKEDDLKVWINGKIDRMDVHKKDGRVYVKIIDYKTGSTEFDITKFYNGLSMQLAVYLDAAMRELTKENPEGEVIPAGVFYYKISDPIINGDPGMTAEEIDRSILKELRMKGLCNNDPDIVRTMDKNISGASNVLPVSTNNDGSLRSSNSAVSTENFQDMREYLAGMITRLADEIMSGKAEVCPYELKEKTGCDICSFRAVCRFDESVEGFNYRECRSADWNDLKSS